MALFTMSKDQCVFFETKKNICLCEGEKLEKLHVHFKAPPLAIVPIEQPQALNIDENNLEDVYIILDQEEIIITI